MEHSYATMQSYKMDYAGVILSGRKGMAVFHIANPKFRVYMIILEIRKSTIKKGLSGKNIWIS